LSGGPPPGHVVVAIRALGHALFGAAVRRTQATATVRSVSSARVCPAVATSLPTTVAAAIAAAAATTTIPPAAVTAAPFISERHGWPDAAVRCRREPNGQKHGRPGGEEF
jgi:hypothetical protein